MVILSPNIAFVDCITLIFNIPLTDEPLSKYSIECIRLTSVRTDLGTKCMSNQSSENCKVFLERCWAIGKDAIIISIGPPLSIEPVKWYIVCPEISARSDKMITRSHSMQLLATLSYVCEVQII